MQTYYPWNKCSVLRRLCGNTSRSIERSKVSNEGPLSVVCKVNEIKGPWGRLADVKVVNLVLIQCAKQPPLECTNDRKNSLRSISVSQRVNLYTRNGHVTILASKYTKKWSCDRILVNRLLALSHEAIFSCNLQRNGVTSCILQEKSPPVTLLVCKIIRLQVISFWSL